MNVNQTKVTIETVTCAHCGSFGTEMILNGDSLVGRNITTDVIRKAIPLFENMFGSWSCLDCEEECDVKIHLSDGTMLESATSTFEKRNNLNFLLEKLG